MAKKKATKSLNNRLWVAQMCSLYIAFFLVLMTLGQLFAFEQQPSVVAEWGIVPVGAIAAVATVLVLLQFVAIPALLSMSLLPAIRRISSGAGWLVLVMWLGVSIALLTAAQEGINTGLFGDRVHTPAGLWLVGFTFLLLVIRIASSIQYRFR